MKVSAFLCCAPTTVKIWLLLSITFVVTEAAKIALRPLSAREVYRLLHATGRSDAIPQGRIVTQGIEAITGFATGLIGGNVYRNGAAAQAVTSHEICFNTRNARNLKEAAAIVEAYMQNDSNDKSERVRKSETSRRIKINRRNKLRNGDGKRKGTKRIKNHAALNVSEPDLGTDTRTTNTGTDNEGTVTYTSPSKTTLTNNPTTTAVRAEDDSSSAIQTTNPTISTTTNSDDSDGDLEKDDNGAGTISTFTTWTSNEGAINCLVIQRPRQ